jgi:hypothetical protein
MLAVIFYLASFSSAALAAVWTITGSMNNAREDHTATLLLPNGQVLVAGGFGSAGFLASAELYNPATGTWAATRSMTDARFFHTATLLQNGEVLVAGGQGTGLFAEAELYTFPKDDCKNREWQNFTSAPGPFKNQGQCIQGVK